MKIRPLRLLGPVLVLAVFSLAVWLLVRQVRQFTYREIVDSLHAIPTHYIAAAVVLTMVNYAILVAYDALAVYHVGQKLKVWQVATVALISYPFSYNFGATLAGVPVRYRLYSAWGVPLVRVVHLLVILGLTFWFGVFALAGTIFLCFPLRIPEDQIVRIFASIQTMSPDMKARLEHAFRFLFTDSRPFGTVLVVIALLYIGISATHNGTIKLFRREIPAPPLKLSIYQVLIASADMLVAGWVLWFLFPAAKGGYMTVLAVYMVAYVLVVLSHVPGGWGVLEALCIGLLDNLELVSHERMPQVVAGLVIFRVIYFLGPLVFATGLFAVNEWRLQKAGWKASAAESK